MLSVSLENLYLKNEGAEKLLLQNIDFQSEANKINIILGKNGSGKSTLIKSITRLLDERFYKISGKIIFNEKDLLTLSIKELLEVRRKNIKYVFQDAINSFDPLKKLNYYFKNFSNQKQLDSFLEYFLLPDKDKLLKLYPYELSGGMAQRVLLIISLLADPDILILDEPTSGIDSPIANLILLKLKEFISAKNKSVLLVTQDLQFAKSAGDRLAFLNDKTLSPFLSTDDFFSKPELSYSSKFIESFNQL